MNPNYTLLSRRQREEQETRLLCRQTYNAGAEINQLPDDLTPQQRIYWVREINLIKRERRYA